jgi:hypothetical protein
MKIWYPHYCSVPSCRRFIEVTDYWLEIGEGKEDDYQIEMARLLLLPLKCAVCGEEMVPVCPL